MQHSEGFQDLALEVQTIITKLAQGPQGFDELRSFFQIENASIKGHITNELRHHRRDLAHNEYCQRFLNSLRYDQIYTRQENVKDAHKETFQWIYKRDGLDHVPVRWHDFAQWLEEGGGIYWISGKAGSGKSTLMSYICQHDQTSKSLSVWSGGKEVFAPRFFFWNPGSALERSSEGLLRSLLYQILQKFPSLTPIPSDHKPVIEPAEDSEHNFQPIAAWTERRLHATFQSVMRLAQEMCHICIFIDGLDEISGDPDALIAMIRNLQSASVKVCLSSRPDRAYNDAFKSYPMLRLQDLTEEDIKTYVSDKLNPFLPSESSGGLSKVLGSVTRGAQGVFLWVELVVKSLIRGLQNDDSFEQLEARVDSTPSDIEALYAKMLSDIDVAYRPEAAVLFRMALNDMTGSLLNVSLTLCKAFECISEMSIVKALGFSIRTQARIPTVCAGLLEVHVKYGDYKSGMGFVAPEAHHLTLRHRYECSPEMDKLSLLERHAPITFIHRTAIDFLRRNKQAELFLEENSQSCPSFRSIYVRALLAKVLLLGFPKEIVHVWGSLGKDFPDFVARKFVHEVMHNVSREEYETGTAQLSLCEDIDRTLTTVYQRSRTQYPLSHWCTRWGIVPKGIFAPEQAVQWSTTSSRSSSQTSFHSTRSKLMPFLDGAVDFLGLAASWGLSVYVIEIFDSKQKHLDKMYANYLLCCSAWALKWSDWWSTSDGWTSGISRLMAELLNRGGNPNFNLEHISTTVWELFLGISLMNDNMPALEVMKAFLEMGADVNAKASHIMRLSAYSCLDAQRSSKAGKTPILYLREKMSPMYLVRHWLSKMRHRLITIPSFVSEMKALESIVESKGGKDSHKFTSVTLYTGTYPLQQLPQTQHDNILTALNAAHYGHGFRNGVHPKWMCPEWKRCLEKISRQILQMYGDSDLGTSSDEDLTSDTEIFYDSMDIQTVVDKQDEISARFFPGSARPSPMQALYRHKYT